MRSLLLVIFLVSEAQAQFTCQRIDTPVSVRSEGLSELLSDVVLKCTGGIATRSGAVIPKMQVVLASTTPFSSRILLPGTAGTGMNEALLLIDEPGFNEQVGCEAGSGGEGCAAIAGTFGNANVFQGRQVQANSIAFRGVPLDPPGPGKTRTVRITNLRANIAALSGPLNISVQITDPNGTTVPIKDADKLSGIPKPGLGFEVRTLNDQSTPLKNGPAITVPPASVPVGAPQAALGFNLKFSEGFAGAFRRRNVATSPDSPLFVTVQPVPGLRNATETGFFNSVFPTANSMHMAGLADNGTRLRVKFTNIPKDILIWVSVRDVKTGTTDFSDTIPRAILTATDPNGAGALAPMKAGVGGMAQLVVGTGTATAVWEVVSGSPDTIQDISFSVAFSAQTAAPGQGTVMVTGGFAALDPPAVIPPAAGTPTAVAPVPVVPLFKDVSKVLQAFAVSNVITVPAFSCTSAASYGGAEAAPGSIVAGFGSSLAAAVVLSDKGPLPNLLGGLTVDLIDTNGIKRSAPLFFVSPGQVNFLLDPDISLGPVLVNLNGAGRLIASGYLQVDSVAPSLFTANGNGSGVFAGDALLISGSRSLPVSVMAYDDNKSKWVEVPMDVGNDGELLFLTLYGTGVRGRRSLSEVRALVNGVPVPVTYAGPQGYFPGLDQINVGPIPKGLRGAGIAQLQLIVRDKAANPVTLQIR